MNKNILKHLGFAALLALGANAWAANVAKIGTAEYETLAEAFAAVKPGETVELLSNIEVSAPLTCGTSNFTFDGNDHMIKCASGFSPWTGNLLKISGADVTVKNFVLDGRGTLGYDYNGSLLRVEGGNKICRNVTLQNAYCTVRWNYVNAGSSVTFDGCTFRPVVYGIHFDGNGGTVNVLNSTVEGFCTFNNKFNFENCRFTATKTSYSVVQAYDGMTVRDCIFDEKWFATGTIYTGSAGNDGKGMVCEYYGIKFDDGHSHEYDEFIGATANSLVAIDPTKDANGKYTAGTFFVGTGATIPLAAGYKAVAVTGKDGMYTVVAETKPEVEVEEPTPAKVEEATKVIDEQGQVVEPTDAQKTAAATEMQKVVEALANPEIAKVEKTGVVEAATVTTGGDSPKTEVKGSVVAALQAAAKEGGVPGDEAEAKITPDSTVKSYIKIALNETKVAVVDQSAEIKSITFDVKPMAETTITTGGDKVQTIVAQIPNEEIKSPITFRLPLTDAFTVSAIITHVGDADRLCMVQGAAGSRYVELTASHFSLYTATPSDIVETTTESKNVLGIKRVDYTVTQSTADLAASVPWLKAAGADMPVSQLITTGLSAGDQIQVYDLSAKAYFSWHYDGSVWTADTLSNNAPVPDADAYVLKRGTAFWYKPVLTSGTYTQVGLYSEEAIMSRVDNVHSDSTAASFVNPVYNLLASPKYEAFDIKAKLTAEAGCAAGDVVVVVATGARYRFNGTAWGQDVDQVVDIFGVQVTQKSFMPAEGAIVVPAGTAFWYLSAGGAPEFEW